VTAFPPELTFRVVVLLAIGVCAHAVAAAKSKPKAEIGSVIRKAVSPSRAGRKHTFATVDCALILLFFGLARFAGGDL
jgi:hypothetical protein